MTAKTMCIKVHDMLRNQRKYVLMLIDACIVAASYFVAFSINGLEPFKLVIFTFTVWIYTTVYISTFSIMKVYKNMLRFSGIEDSCRCLAACAAANGLFMAVMLLFQIDIPMDIYIDALFISSLLELALRIVYRALVINRSRKKDKCKARVNTMIIGAGQATAALLNEIKSSSCNSYCVRCILDDDKTKIGRDIKRVPITGDTSRIKEMAEKYEIEEIIISEQSFLNEGRTNILTVAAQTKCRIKILPEVYRIIYDNSKIELSDKLRSIRPEDLLGRDPILLDCGLTRDYINGKTVLITGGGGTIGAELCRQISAYNPYKIIILDEYENNAYEIQQELAGMYGDKINIEVEIATVRDASKLDKIFSTKGIKIVFHAAAHKHVPLMEKNPEEAIKNNIFGTYNAVYMADKYNVEKFVLISTDKAVNPTNVMGATKRVCEMIIQYFDSKSSTDFVAVRFGNVLGSNGSVIPLFINQIKHGGPVTVTHAEITRYFMTIPEAVKLVLKAASIANGGEIFVLDMGQPMKIKDLAYNLILLAGLTPDVDIKIEYIGLRPGEKLYEELLVTEKAYQSKTEIDKIFIEKPQMINEYELLKNIRLLVEAAEKLDLETELNLIEKLVPTYKRTVNNSISPASKEEVNDKEPVTDITSNVHGCVE